jgi:hypothetical protein
MLPLMKRTDSKRGKMIALTFSGPWRCGPQIFGSPERSTSARWQTPWGHALRDPKEADPTNQAPLAVRFYRSWLHSCLARMSRPTSIRTEASSRKPLFKRKLISFSGFREVEQFMYGNAKGICQQYDLFRAGPRTVAFVVDNRSFLYSYQFGKPPPRHLQRIPQFLNSHTQHYTEIQHSLSVVNYEFLSNVLVAHE